MKKKLAFTLFVLALCFLGACHLPNEPDPYIIMHIEGTVTDAANNRALKADMGFYEDGILQRSWTIINLTGKYASTGAIYSGHSYTIRAGAAGYVQQEKPIALTEQR